VYTLRRNVACERTSNDSQLTRMHARECIHCEHTSMACMRLSMSSTRCLMKNWCEPIWSSVTCAHRQPRHGERMMGPSCCRSTVPAEPVRVVASGDSAVVQEEDGRCRGGAAASEHSSIVERMRRVCNALDVLEDSLRAWQGGHGNTAPALL
jgi:hypothetical protein